MRKRFVASGERRAAVEMRAKSAVPSPRIVRPGMNLRLFGFGISCTSCDGVEGVETRGERVRVPCRVRESKYHVILRAIMSKKRDKRVVLFDGRCEFEEEKKDNSSPIQKDCEILAVKENKDKDGCDLGEILAVTENEYGERNFLVRW